ncbi:MAG: hypothetical protein AAF846_26885 [Chloroflexota bacterium]
MQPNLMLLSYPYGWVLHKRIEFDDANNIVLNSTTQKSAGITCDPASLARALMGNTRFTTGFIPDDIIYHEQEGVKQTVVGYRKRQRTGIWLEGREEALRVPLPHLIMIRTTRDGGSPDYKLFACAKRPESLTETLYHAPLPNVFTGGGICWGNVSRPQTKSISLKADWQALLGSRFGNHACSGKCKSHPSDVREMLLELNAAPRRRVYPKRELVATQRTLASILQIDSEVDV